MAALDILTIDEARDAVGLGAAQRGKDELLVPMVTAVSAKLDDYVGPIIIREVVDELHDGGHELVLLKYRPVAAITSVVEYDHTTPTTLTETTNAAKPTDGYRLTNANAGMLARRSYGSRRCFAAGDANIVVTYDAGRFGPTLDEEEAVVVEAVANVEDIYKRAAGITLRAWWAMEDVQVAALGEYDVPASRFTKFALANATRELLDHEARSRVTMA